MNRGRPTGNRPVSSGQRGRSGERGNSNGNSGGNGGNGAPAPMPRPGQCTRTCGPPNRGIACCGGNGFHRSGCPANGNA